MTSLIDKEEFNIILKNNENLKDLINKNTLAVYPNYKEKGISLFNAFHTKVMTFGLERGVMKFTTIGKYKVSEMVNLYAKQYADLFINYNLTKYNITLTGKKDLKKFNKDIFYHEFIYYFLLLVTIFIVSDI